MIYIQKLDRLQSNISWKYHDIFEACDMSKQEDTLIYIRNERWISHFHICFLSITSVFKQINAVEFNVAILMSQFKTGFYIKGDFAHAISHIIKYFAWARLSNLLIISLPMNHHCFPGQRHPVIYIFIYISI